MSRNQFITTILIVSLVVVLVVFNLSEKIGGQARSLLPAQGNLNIVEQSEPVIDMLPEPDIPPPLENKMIEGDSQSPLVVGVDERGWSILADPYFGLKLHFPPDWIFKIDSMQQSYEFRPQISLSDENLSEESLDSFSVLVSSAAEVSREMYDNRDPWQHFTFRMQESGAVKTAFKGYEAYWLEDANVYGNYEGAPPATDGRKSSSLAFRTDTNFYLITVRYLPETSALQSWGEASYFIEAVTPAK